MEHLPILLSLPYQQQLNISDVFKFAMLKEPEQFLSILRLLLNNVGKLENEDEKMQFIVLVGQFMNTWSVMFDLYQEGQLPSNQWYLVNADILSVFSTPGGELFWDKIGRANVHESFASYVDELLSIDESTYSLLPKDVYNDDA